MSWKQLSEQSIKGGVLGRRDFLLPKFQCFGTHVALWQLILASPPGQCAQ